MWQSLWDLVPWPRIELNSGSESTESYHWAAQEFPILTFFIVATEHGKNNLCHLFLLDSVIWTAICHCIHLLICLVNGEKLCIPLSIFFSLSKCTKNPQVSTVFNGEKKIKMMTMKMLSPNFFHNFLKEDLWILGNTKFQTEGWYNSDLFTIASS